MDDRTSSDGVAEESEQSSVPTNDHTSSGFTRVSRRSAIGLGVMGTGLVVGGPFLGSVQGGSDIEIPYWQSGGEIIKWKEVPQKWHERYEEAKSVKQDQESELTKIEGVSHLSIRKNEDGEKVDSYYLQQIGVKVFEENVSDVEGEIPESINGVPLEVVETQGPQPGNCYVDSCFDGPTSWSDPFRPSMGVTTEASGGPFGSAGYSVVYEPTNTRSLLSATHIWLDDNCNPDSHTAYSLDDCHEIGDSVIRNNDNDYIIFEPNSSGNINSIDNEIERVNDKNPNIIGCYTDDGMAEMESSGTIIHFFGLVHHDDVGGLMDINENHKGSCFDTDPHGFTTGIDTQDGDSGGVYATVHDLDGDFEEESAVIVGHNLGYDKEHSPKCGGLWPWDPTSGGDESLGFASHPVDDLPDVTVGIRYDEPP